MSEHRDKAMRAIAAFDQLLAAMDEGRGDAFRAAKMMLENMIQSPHELHRVVLGMRELALREINDERNQAEEGEW